MSDDGRTKGMNIRKDCLAKHVALLSKRGGDVFKELERRALREREWFMNFKLSCIKEQ